ncbi:hypothetical protein FPSE_00610 [Fusarium pseudograminearum CS3096]|uniref:Uncharacterized protein n=1 Tax=Fusarium pseudograminearum (strain CS3096) TaxID=1028729 RepID=K3VUR2_FUSPC|nr:hypothetical protein FPSE_00610 [Fusarium pseudograminearum CS3096]EKJ79299.1 hypothetical protein FPSE_00610 [Fusarium pseudograminearum CS3096]
MSFVPMEEDIRFRGLQASRTATWKYLVSVFLRWVVTLLLSIAIWKILWFYSEAMVIMAKPATRDFNVWITGLTIALGLAFAGSLDKLARDTRWWILSRRHRSRRKLEAILEAENVLSVLQMAFSSRRITIQVTAWSWFLVFVASQIGLAVLGLFYSVDVSDKLALQVIPGNVSIANMSAVQPLGFVFSDSQSRSDQEYAANMYGAMSLTYLTGVRGLEPQIGDLRLASDPDLFCDINGCDFMFVESSVPSDPEKELAEMSSWQPIMVATPRKMAISTKCESYPVISGGDGSSTEIEYRKNATSGKGQETVRVGVPFTAETDQTIFITNTSTTCGSGCSTVMALETSAKDPWFYSCNTTVGAVTNGTIPEHQVPEYVRVMVSHAIALQGFSANSSFNTSDLQYLVYPAQSPFRTPLQGTVQAIELTVSRFAAGVIAMMAKVNDAIVVDGLPPTKGWSLNVDHWDYILIILAVIVWFQFAFSVVVAFMATRVVMPHGGATSMAKVLCAMAADDDPNGTDWIYRSRKVSADGVYDLYLEGRPRAEQQGKSF